MIKRIKSVKNFGILDEMDVSGAPDLKRFNIIYGWNGTGKTTLSRLFRCLETGNVSPFHPTAKVTFQTLNGLDITQEDLKTTLSVRVYNPDFITENIQWEGELKAIFFLGSENIKLNDKLKSLLQLKDNVEKTLSNLKDSRKNTIETIEDDLTREAGKIKSSLTTSIKDSYRTYMRPKIEAAIDKNLILLNSDISSFLLSPNEIENYNKEIQSVRLEEIVFEFSPVDQIMPTLISLENVLRRSITAKVITHLEKDPILNKWVKDGLDIHHVRQNDNCGFCGQIVSPIRIEELNAHFSESYKQLMDEINRLERTLTEIKLQNLLPTSVLFYDNLRTEYDSLRKNLIDYEQEVNRMITEWGQALALKKSSPFQNIEFNFSDYKVSTINISSKYQNVCKKIEALVSQHSRYSNNIEAAIALSKSKLENNSIAQIFPSYKEKKVSLQGYENDIAKYTEELSNVNREIKEIEKDLVNHGLAADTFNIDLKDFLGRNDIKIIPTDNGYQLFRGEALAKNLSEGEKTAITFVYFITKLREKDFDLTKSIIVVDDPISSLDANHVFNVFSYIRKYAKDAAQLIVLTHNFSFLRFIQNWLQFSKDMKKAHQKFYVETILGESGNRKVRLKELDKLLDNYNSEYCYLFSILDMIANQDEKELSTVYPLPNMARKLLEAFFAFKNPHQKFEDAILEYNLDELKVNRVLRYINTYSHAKSVDFHTDFDPYHLGNAKNIIQDVLYIIKEIDPVHYTNSEKQFPHKQAAAAAL